MKANSLLVATLCFLGYISFFINVSASDYCYDLIASELELKSPVIILSAIGDGFGYLNELNGQSTKINLQENKVSSFLSFNKPVNYSDDTAMSVIRLNVLEKLKNMDMFASKDLSFLEGYIANEKYSLKNIHSYLQQVSGEQLETHPFEYKEDRTLLNFINNIGEAHATGYFQYYKYWTAGRAPGIGCTASIQGEENQEGLSTVSAQLKQEENKRDYRWWNCGNGKLNPEKFGGGNGALMRAYPSALFLYRYPKVAAMVTLIDAHITHSADIGAIPAAVFTYALAKACARAVNNWELIFDDLIEAAQYFDMDYSSAFNSFYNQGIDDSESFELSNNKMEAFVDLWDRLFDNKEYLAEDRILYEENIYHNTWTGIGALNAAIYMMGLCGKSDNPIQALQWAGHIQGDSDSVGTIVGSILGVIYSLDELREKEALYPVVGVFDEPLLDEKSLVLLEDYQLLKKSSFEEILTKHESSKSYFLNFLK